MLLLMAIIKLLTENSNTISFIIYNEEHIQ